MKIKASIHTVEDSGESIKIKAQGTAKKGGAYLNEMATIELKMPNSKTNRKSFYLGRDIEITVKPK